ncbi:MFS transporter [Pseudoduganella eburnea]|uniref:MFS transporter n=1 Tax=Massilia eburnea TaxID=1776165 RepID=A0A6L6QLH9_9BURK|nr:MFS transporter [Massilia eburnea]MTW13000.1 MFS transporter [Massilia eburnea]
MKALYHPTNRAMFFGGFSCFALLYCVQPLMPLFSHEFALTPAKSSLSLSLATAAMAVSLVASSAISDRYGRKPLMVAALAISAVMTLLCALADSYGQLLAARVLLGVALGGMPAVAMAYLAEEIEAESLGLSMGLYISGSAFGGMVGRMVTSVLSDFFSWRVALVAMGVAGVLAAAEFWRSLPESRRFRASAGGWRALPQNARKHLSDDGLPWLFALAFLLMGCMVSAYNYISYRLLASPFQLRQSVVGGISFLYLLGIFSSVWAGKLADRYGRKGVLYLVLSLMLGGIALTLSSWLPLVIAGLALFTFAFFASHSMTSSWVGRRARGAALASALYLFFYYLGSSVIGWAAGILWGRAGWAGVVMLLGSCLLGAVAIALHLRKLTPIAPTLSQIKAEAG